MKRYLTWITLLAFVLSIPAWAVTPSGTTTMEKGKTTVSQPAKHRPNATIVTPSGKTISKATVVKLHRARKAAVRCYVVRGHHKKMVMARQARRHARMLRARRHAKAGVICRVVCRPIKRQHRLAMHGKRARMAVVCVPVRAHRVARHLAKKAAIAQKPKTTAMGNLNKGKRATG